MKSKFRWPSLGSLRGSDRRPKSPSVPSRPKPEPAPKRASSMPRLSEAATPESGTTPSVSTNPIVVRPPVSLPTPVAVEATSSAPAPEDASDAATLPLPGLPGASGRENPASPVEEEPALVDPYVTADEGVTSTEPTLPGSSPIMATSSTITGVLPADLPLPEVSDLGSKKPEPVVKLTEPTPIEKKEASSSEPSAPAVEPPPVEAEADKSTGTPAEEAKSAPESTAKSSTEKAESDEPTVAPKAKAKSASTRKPPKKTTEEEETAEQKEKREKAEKAVEELVRQEAEEKKKQTAKDAKSKKAAAENTEKAREAAAQQRKGKESTADAEKTITQKRRIKASVSDQEDKPPPEDDDQPWEIYHYRPHVEVDATLGYESEESGVKQYDLASTYNLDVQQTRTPLRGPNFKIHEATQALQQGKRRVREIRAEQIERLVGTRATVPNGPHPCVLRGGLSLMRVSIPYHKNGSLMLGNFPGMKPQRHTIKSPYRVPTLELNMDLDKPNRRPDMLTHLAIYTAGSAIGYETRGLNPRAENKADWFTPEVLRAARVFLKDLSTAQFANQGATKVEKPGFLYYPSELSGILDEANKGRWVHLVSFGLQVSQIQWAALRKLPFYVRGLLREVPIALIPEVCTIAALTDPDIEVLMDHHLMLWVRSKTWSECRPFAGTMEMDLAHEDSIESQFATIAVTEMELAEAFLEQQNEGQQPLPDRPDPEDETIEEGVVAGRRAPSIHEKGKGKGKKGDDKGKGKGNNRPRSRGRSGPVTRSAYIMPGNRYPVAMEGAHTALQPKHYTVIFDVLRAVQYGAVFSAAVNKAGQPRGQYVTSGIPANAIVQIRTGNGQVLNPNTLGMSEWHSSAPVDVQSNTPTIKVTGRAEMPSLEIYHAQLSKAEQGRWSRTLRQVQTFPEGHLDEQIGERGLRKAIPPTGISYAEFVGMRPRTMSQMHFRKEGRLVILRDDKRIEFPELEKGEKKKKGKGKGKTPLSQIDIKNVDPQKLKWEPLWNKNNDPHKGSGRANSRTFSKETLTYLVESMLTEQALELEEDPTAVRARIPPDQVPVHPSKKGKGGDNKRSKAEHLDTVETKRAKWTCMHARKLAKQGSSKYDYVF